MRKNSGSTYIFVLVIAAAVFIILSLVLRLTKLNADISHAYTNNANLYYLAEAGVFKGLKIIDEAVSTSGLGDIGSDNDYHELLSYGIDTIHKENVYVTYNVIVYIKAASGTESYNILSVAGNGEAFVNVLGSVDLELNAEGKISAVLTGLRQVD